MDLRHNSFDERKQEMTLDEFVKKWQPKVEKECTTLKNEFDRYTKHNKIVAASNKNRKFIYLSQIQKILDQHVNALKGDYKNSQQTTPQKLLEKISEVLNNLKEIPHISSGKINPEKLSDTAKFVVKLQKELQTKFPDLKSEVHYTPPGAGGPT